MAENETPPPEDPPQPQPVALEPLDTEPRNPILRDEELKRWSVTAPRPVPRADTRLVFMDGKGRTHAPEQPVTLGEAVWGRLQRMYEVDLKEYPAQFRDRLPCKEKGFYFEVLFSLNWRVHDPEQIVLDGRSDIRPLYQRHLKGRLVEYSETYGLEQRRTAEEQLNEAIRVPMVLPQGITVSGCGVSLTLGAEAEEHLRERTRAAFRTETRVLKHDAALHDARLELELFEARKEIEVLKQRHELNLKSERLLRYGEMLANGNYAALFLEAEPENAGDFLKLFLNQKRQEMENARDVLRAMLESGLVNGADIDEPRRAALTKILDGLNSSSMDSITGTRSTPAIEAPRERRTRRRRDEDDDPDDD